MSDHLPDNLSDWPDDVYELLGVDREADTKTLRRAYTRLIRKFKPDHFPDEFQRIREAYDATRQFAELRVHFEPVDGEWSDITGPKSGDPSEADGDDHHAEPGSEGEMLVLRPNSDAQWDVDGPADATDADAAWRTGRDGDLDAALAQLEQLHDREPDNEEVIVRLFWIRKLQLAEKAASSAEVVNWLCRIVKRRGLRGRPWQLLIEELQTAPVLSRCEAVSELLQSSESADRIVPLLLTRWRSAGRVQRWSAIDEDLNAVRDRFLPDHPGEWVEVVLAALRMLVWSRSTDVTSSMVDGVLELGTSFFERWFNELGGFEELHLMHPHVFDERDELVELRDQLDDSQQAVPGRIRHLLLEEAVGRNAAIRNRVLNLARNWSQFPGSALEQLDGLAQSRPMVLIRLWQCVSRHNQAGWYLPEGQSDAIVRQVERMVESTDWSSINNARISVFEFCVRESLPLRQVAHAVTQSTALLPDTIESLSGFFYSDAALACLCECVQAGHCQ